LTIHEPSAAHPPPTPGVSGVPRDLLIPRDFVMLHLELVDMLSSLEAAVLLLRIQYRAGEGWWEVTKAEMQADTRLSERKLDRALRELIDAGFVEWERAAPATAKRRCRVRFDTSGTKPPGRNVPDVQDETSRSSMSLENSKNTTSSGSAGPRVYDSVFEERFWAFWPNKSGKPTAERAWRAALKRDSIECILAGLHAHLPAVEEKRKRGFLLTASKWLNDDGWNDELTPLRHAREKPERGDPFDPARETHDQYLTREGWR
jgi:hypothetical protein